MNQRGKITLMLLSALFLSAPLCAQKTVTWELAEMPRSFNNDLKVIGNPLIVKTKLGDAVYFDGIDDGYLCNINPLVGMKAFTLEVVFKPDGDGFISPRFIHFGEVSGKRLMLETRINEKNQWYFDAHLNAGENNSLTLIDSTLTHNSDQWYTLTVVAANGTMTTYVNGIKELGGNIEFTPFNSGKASLGFRQNFASWFKGTIYKIRITPSALIPHQFLNLHNKLN